MANDGWSRKKWVGKRGKCQIYVHMMIWYDMTWYDIWYGYSLRNPPLSDFCICIKVGLQWVKQLRLKTNTKQNDVVRGCDKHGLREALLTCHSIAFSRDVYEISIKNTLGTSNKSTANTHLWAHPLVAIIKCNGTSYCPHNALQTCLHEQQSATEAHVCSGYITLQYTGGSN